MTHIDSQSVQLIYRRHGDQTEQQLRCSDPEPEVVRAPTIADLVPITQVMTRRVTCARCDLDAQQLVELMVRERIGSNAL